MQAKESWRSMKAARSPIPTGVLGNSSGGEGAVTMNDGTWSNTDDLKVGFQGGGNLTQTDGEISAPIVHVAEIAGSTGELNLNGEARSLPARSRWAREPRP